jgi:hypothetical protein
MSMLEAQIEAFRVEILEALEQGRIDSGQAEAISEWLEWNPLPTLRASTKPKEVQSRGEGKGMGKV